MARFRAPGMDAGRGVRFHQRELQCRRGLEPAQTAAEAPSADHERRRIARGTRFHHALLRHEFRHPQGPHPSRRRKGADRSSQADGPLARARNADLDPRLRRLPRQREGGQGLSQLLRLREGRLGGCRQSPEDFRAAQSNPGRQDARRTQGAFHRRSRRLPAGGNGGTDRRRARQARRYRGRRLPDLLGQIQRRAGAVERGGSSADGAVGIARAVPAGADAARRDDAVARGRRGSGLKGIPTMRRIVLACLSLLVLVSASGERARADESYPSKPIRLVLPQPAGGAVDLIARALGDRLSYALRQPVIVENQPGANGGLAAGQVARAAPDGYTLLMAVDTNLVVNPNLYPNLAYDPFSDFMPISIIAKVYLVLVATSKIEANSVAELLAFARAHPGKLNYASIGLGTQAHLGMELLKIMTKTDIAQVSYRGTAPAMTDIAAGVVDVMFTGPALGHGARSRRQGQDLGDRVAFALEPDAAGSDHAGSRRAGLRAQRMVRIAGAGQDAAARRRPARQRGQDGGRRWETQGSPGRAGFGRGRSSSEEMLAVMTADTKKWSEVIAATGAKVPQ